MSYILLVEWDGNKPPSQWYRRLAHLGLTAGGHGSKDTEGVIARRTVEAGVTYQEGAIICAQETTARTLAHLASEMRAKAVSVARLEIEEMLMTEEDQKSLDRVARTLKRKGRPPKDEPTDWVVTCLDEGRTYQLLGHREPAYCPKCASFRNRYRDGVQQAVALPSGNLLDVWQKTRFLTGAFEVPAIDPLGLPANGEAQEAADRAAIQCLGKSKLMGQVAGLDLDTALRLLDLGYLNLTFTQEDRQTKRIHSITNFIQRGGNAARFMLVSQPNDVEIIDLGDADPALITRLLSK